jgi:hypothetical protein
VVERLAGDGHHQFVDEDDVPATKSDEGTAAAVTPAADVLVDVNGNAALPSSTPDLNAAAPAAAGADGTAPAGHNDHHHGFVWNIEDHLEVDWVDRCDPGTAASADVPAVPADDAPAPEFARVLYEIRLAQLVDNSNRTLRVVASLLPNDDDNLAALGAVVRVINQTTSRSHLQALRLMASCQDPAKAVAFEAAGVTPLHEFSLFAAAAAALVTEVPGRPTVLLPTAEDLSRTVLNDVVGGPLLWNMLGSAAPRSTAGDSFAAATAEATAAANAAAGGAAGSSGSMYTVADVSRLLHRVTRAGAELHAEVRGRVDWQAEDHNSSHYLSQIASITDQTTGLGDLEKKMSGKADAQRRKAALQMYGMASFQGDDDRKLH